RATKSCWRAPPAISSTTCARHHPRELEPLARQPADVCSANTPTPRARLSSTRSSHRSPAETPFASDESFAGRFWSQPLVVVGQWPRPDLSRTAARPGRARLGDHLFRARRGVVSLEPRPAERAVLRPAAVCRLAIDPRGSSVGG